MFLDFVAIDFETANSNNNSACSLGVAVVKNLKIIHTKHFLIRPPVLKFNSKNINLHGITPDDVTDSPLFPEVWEQIKHYFDENIIVAHNAAFDMSVLKCCLMEYNIKPPNFTYMCSMQMSNCVCDDSIVRRSLEDRANYFNIELANHHDALSDAIACAKLVISVINEIKRGNLCSPINHIALYRFDDFRATRSLNKGNRRFQKINISEIKPSKNNIDNTSAFYGKNIVFTGELMSLGRREAMQKVVDLGGIIKSSVSSKTDFLIVGIQDKSIVGEDGMSSKEEVAYRLKEKGHHIQIITEQEFLRLLQSADIDNKNCSKNSL